MLRGIQLAARFALQIEPATRESMHTHAAAITTVAPERIAEELRKLLQAWAPSQGFVVMHEVGLLMHILPELARLADGAAFTRTIRRLDAVQQCERLSYRGDLDLLLAALLCDSGLSAATQTGTAGVKRPGAGFGTPGTAASGSSQNHYNWRYACPHQQADHSQRF